MCQTVLLQPTVLAQRTVHRATVAESKPESHGAPQGPWALRDLLPEVLARYAQLRPVGDARTGLVVLPGAESMSQTPATA